MTYAERFKKALSLPGKTRKGVAAAMQVTVQAVGRIVNGHTKAASAKNNAAAAQYFEVDATWLATGKGPFRSIGADRPTALSGVVAAEPTPIAYGPTPLDTLAQVARLLRPCPVSVRETVAGLLQRLAMDPDDASLPHQIVALISVEASVPATKRASNG